MCNSPEEMENGIYYEASYDEWMDRLEESLQKKYISLILACYGKVKVFAGPVKIGGKEIILYFEQN